MVCDIDIQFFGGTTPVQCWGTLSGRDFYFRARWSSWSFGVGEARYVLGISDADEAALDFHLENDYGDGPYDAGYMPFADSRRIVADCIAQYAAEHCGDSYDDARNRVLAWFDRWLQTNLDYDA